MYKMASKTFWQQVLKKLRIISQDDTEKLKNQELHCGPKNPFFNTINESLGPIGDEPEVQSETFLNASSSCISLI